MSLAVPSICIPQVNGNIPNEYIRNVFERLGFGHIARLDIVNKKTKSGLMCKRVFVHYTQWNDTADINKIKQDLINGKTLNVVHDNENYWFWKISALKNT